MNVFHRTSRHRGLARPARHRRLADRLVSKRVRREGLPRVRIRSDRGFGGKFLPEMRHHPVNLPCQDHGSGAGAMPKLRSRSGRASMGWGLPGVRSPLRRPPEIRTISIPVSISGRPGKCASGHVDRTHDLRRGQPMTGIHTTSGRDEGRPDQGHSAAGDRTEGGRPHAHGAPGRKPWTNRSR